MPQVRKQTGKITNWRLYRVHFTGTNDEYNYVSVSYYDSWPKTEGNDDWADLLKKSNPNADPAVLTKTLELRKIVRQSLYSRLDATAPNDKPVKFVQLGFMKASEGQTGEYEKLEKEIWKPLHQLLVNDGKRSGWAFWELVYPGGSQSSHDYVTSNAFASYGQLGEVNYEEGFKKAHPGKDLAQTFDKTLKSRAMVRTELWELIDSTN
jgi:hypothetical protein